MIPSPDAEEKDVSELLARCESSLTTRNFQEAITGCRAVLNISPENPRAKALMDEAQSKLEAELFAKENLGRANEFFRLRNFEKCINECQKVLLLEPDNQECNVLIERAQEKLEAEPFIQNFISSGRSLFENGLYEEAIAQWEKVRSIDSTYPDLDRLINNARQMMNPVTSQSFAPLEETPDGFDAGPETVAAPAPGAEGSGFISDQDRIHQLLQEGDELYDAGQYQKAIEVWSEIFMLDVNHPEALQKIEAARSAASQQRLKLRDMLKNAQMAYEQGNVGEAHDLFKQVKSLDPENTEAAKYLSLIDRADREPSSLDELISLGESAEKQGKYREAAQYLSQALAVDSENAQLADRIKNLNLLAKKQEQGKTLLGNARAFVAEGKAESARHALSKILESDPSNQEALDLLRQLKETAGPAAQAGARPGRAVPATADASRFPVIPVAVAALLLIVVAIFGYGYFFRDNSDITQPIAPIKRGVRNPAAAANQTPDTAIPADPIQSRPPANEGKDQKVDRLVREANFYFHEKHYEEALKKAQEALQIDPLNKDAIGLKLDSNKMMADARASEQKLLDEANAYFSYSDFAGAVKLYEKYLEKHPETRASIQPLILKSYYNLGVIAIREWRCDTAADYFRQVLFIDETDQLSKDALGVARQCQKSGTTDLEVRKAVALMEMRR
jgi:tetratricopeptide (TPR) repeat protein